MHNAVVDVLDIARFAAVLVAVGISLAAFAPPHKKLLEGHAAKPLLRPPVADDTRSFANEHGYRGVPFHHLAGRHLATTARRSGAPGRCRHASSRPTVKCTHFHCLFVFVCLFNCTVRGP